MHIDGGSCQTPGGAGILEIADQLLLGVNADGRPPRGGKRRALSRNILELGIAVGMPGAASSFLAFTCRA